MEYKIRQGGVADMQALFNLIQELAVFEKAPHMVRNTPEQLQADFELHQAYAFLVAEVEGEVVGISLYYPRYSTWNGRCYYLEDLYVQPAHRGVGIGEALLRATADKAKTAGATRLDWQVLDWNTDAVRFYERIGAKVEREWWNCKWIF
jgi:GNAT superfamily N-acetyltransferase